MKDGTKNIIAACILAFGMIFSVYIYVSVSRYEYTYLQDGSTYKNDTWTGRFVFLDTKTGKEIKR